MRGRGGALLDEQRVTQLLETREHGRPVVRRLVRITVRARVRGRVVRASRPWPDGGGVITR